MEVFEGFVLAFLSSHHGFEADLFQMFEAVGTKKIQ